MEELVKVSVSDKGNQVVSGRELYAFLEVSTDFTDWMKRMFTYGFEANVDYAILLPKNEEQKGSGGHNKIEYVLTLNCAKEISMLQRSDKGKQARLYFIACEEKLNKPMTMLESAKALVASLELIESQKVAIDNMSVAFNHASQWLSILKVSMHNRVNESEFSWQKLKAMSKEMGYEVKRMPSRRYEYQNIYHVSVWKRLYPFMKYDFNDIEI